MGRLTSMLLAAGLAACTGTADKADDDTDTDTDTVVDTDTHTIADTDTDTDTDADSDPDTDLPEPSCEIGTGETAFVALTSGQDVEVTRGPQGGWHVWGSVRCVGLHPGGDITNLPDLLREDNPTVTWQILAGTTPVGGYATLKRPMYREDGTGLVGEILLMRTQYYAQAVNRDVILHFEITDVNDRYFTTDLPVHLVPEDDWVPQDSGL